jgi:hypothetical protein
LFHFLSIALALPVLRFARHTPYEVSAAILFAAWAFLLPGIGFLLQLFVGPWWEQRGYDIDVVSVIIKIDVVLVSIFFAFMVLAYIF